MLKKNTILFVLLLSGCASYQPQPLDPSAMMTDYQSRSLNNTELQHYLARQGKANLQRWDLDSLLLVALFYSPELDMAKAQIAGGKAAIETAAQRPNPVLSLPFQYQPGIPKPWTLGPDIDIPIETAGKRDDRIAQASQLSLAAKLNAGQTVWLLRERLRSSLLDLYTAEQKAQLLQLQVDSQQDIVNIMSRRTAEGLASPSDTGQARSQLLRTRALLLPVEQQQQTSRAQIATLLGLPVTALTAIHFDFRLFEQHPAQLPSSQVQRQALLNRLDLQSALAQYQASEAALKLEVARQYPDISLGLGYSWDQGANKYSFTPAGLTLPLFNHNEGPIAEAEAHRKEAAARVALVQDTAINEVSAALQDYQHAVTTLDQAYQLFQQDAVALDHIRNARSQGEVDRLALIQQQLLNDTDAQSLLDARIQLQQAIGKLENALQRPLNGIFTPVTEAI